MFITALTCALTILPLSDVARESVDLIELNHYFDQEGRLVFDQVIFYDWSEGDARYNVREWRLVKNPAQIPSRDWNDGGYRAMWDDGALVRQVRSKSYRETWTQYDPELEAREVLPKESRRTLRAR